jgi:hypothetical protein
VKALEHETEQMLGQPLARYDLSVAATIRQADALLSLSLRIVLRSQAEVPRMREVQAASCQELLEAAAVAIALAAAESGDGTADVKPTQAQDSERVPLAATRAAPPVVEEQLPLRDGAQLGAAAVGDLGVFPAPALGPELQLLWSVAWFQVGVSGSWFPTRRMSVPDAPAVRFGMYFADVHLGGQARVGRYRVSAAAVAELGRIQAQLADNPTAREQNPPWRALGVRLGFSIPLIDPLELSVGLAVLRPLTRPQFFAEGLSSPSSHQPAGLVGRLMVGLVFSL